MRHALLLLLTAILVAGCTNDKPKESVTKTETKPSRTVNIPDFNADSAYHYVEKQVQFGPRIPNTKPHVATRDYLVAEFKRLKADVRTQQFKAPTFDGQQLELTNIIASYFPDQKKRILLAAHWDTRPFADKDTNNKGAKFDGANDGASGVAVLLEIARVLSTADSPPDVGVDIILFDGEDWGEPVGAEENVPLAEGLESWWCLGSQHWSKNKHVAGYAAFFGILLDMVGAKNAQFHKEGYSVEFAPSITDKVWNIASQLGYGHLFVPQRQEGIIDDHYFVNTVGRIPMIDIIHFQPGGDFFGDFHHTTKDNMDLISKETLKAVGHTVLGVLYYEDPA